MTRDVAQHLGAVDPVQRHRPALARPILAAAPSPEHPDRGEYNEPGTWSAVTLALWHDLWERVLRAEAEHTRLRRENHKLRHQLAQRRVASR